MSAEIQQSALVSVQIGPIQPLGPERVPSGFVKHPVTGPVAVGPLGLDGDAQADLSVHGGTDKAVYGYAASHYPAWIADYPPYRDRFVPGAFGENLTMLGLNEADLCAGDVHAIGTVHLQVCQPRQPCFKLALHFADNRLPRAMTQNRRSGWYYRVLQPGHLTAGDAVRVIDRPHPDLPFDRLIDFVNRVALDEGIRAQIAGANGVAAWLRQKALSSL